MDVARIKYRECVNSIDNFSTFNIETTNTMKDLYGVMNETSKVMLTLHSHVEVLKGTANTMKDLHGVMIETL